MRRRGAKNHNQKASTRAETKIREASGRKSAQKGPIWRRIGNARFAKTGWWCAQSYANQSPCYLANIRVIFENNSVPAAKSVKKTCGTGISLILRQFDIREEQGAPNCRNTERAFDELGGGKRTHSDQESGPTSYGLIQALRENDVNVVDYKPKGEKEERLGPAAEGSPLAGGVCGRVIV